MNNTNEQFKLKKTIDGFFNQIFFTEDFRNQVIKKFKYCPQGLGFDTCFYVEKDESDEYAGEPYFLLCSKIYGDEYNSNDKVTGDYHYGKYEGNQEVLEFCKKYLYDKAPELYDKIKKYDFLY